jgi:hypothetical protein
MCHQLIQRDAAAGERAPMKDTAAASWARLQLFGTPMASELRAAVHPEGINGTPVSVMSLCISTHARLEHRRSIACSVYF